MILNIMVYYILKMQLKIILIIIKKFNNNNIKNKGIKLKNNIKEFIVIYN